ncbi:hypothetical protein KSS93_12075 [Pseudomonas xanthosomatis]|uniref:hypothetical protein n=1 Tax=Pseudomonas xanthosomatis TaxID=2842356 RepID=UPI001C3C52E1|nr:hypothetical protein [Pseudomonas xanthosomatis]QXH48590.1 hypothetical protein KSS93_12075 [Pseudomonas xanthosomatis]
MPENTYAPPQPDLATTPEATAQPPFYVVSRGKFLTLHILSLGLYQLYWAYKNWKQVERSTGEKLWPVARAFFALFFTHALYREADTRLKRDGNDFDWNPKELATLFVVIMLINNVIDVLARREIGYPFTDTASLALLPITGWVTWLGQRALNAAAGDPTGRSNARFTVLNYVFMVPGALLLALACFGLTLPPQ